ncbi:M23 family metallopeptidase [Novosphingobium sp. ZN18A2]|uniref:M23 family metallopeptidase n=1 Tax=Novosphingobium sp. ZN18A2 TaxID=3079861 RepID=UPI0030CAACFA
MSIRSPAARILAILAMAGVASSHAFAAEPSVKSHSRSGVAALKSNESVGAKLVTWPVSRSVPEPAARTLAPARVTVVRSTGAADVSVLRVASDPAVVAGRAMDLSGSPVDFAGYLRAQRLLAASKSGFSGGTGGVPSGMPLSSPILTSRFGMRWHPLLGGERWHSGVDLGAPYGAPIEATADGIVRSAGWAGGYGLMVSLDNGKGVQTRYAHMSRMTVAAGQAVHAGDVIGYVGSTGLSTGPHLHYEVRIDGHAVNPLGR